MQSVQKMGAESSLDRQIIIDHFHLIKLDSLTPVPVSIPTPPAVYQVYLAYMKPMQACTRGVTKQRKQREVKKCLTC